MLALPRDRRRRSGSSARSQSAACSRAGQSGSQEASGVASWQSGVRDLLAMPDTDALE
jgi:hypothetical protein